MNPHLIGELVRLRYRLLWARARTRNGRIALLIAGCLVFMLAMALVSRGGAGAAVVAVRSGRTQIIAEIVLTSVFVQAVLVSVILGFGMNAIFSDFELRRYPVRALDRHMTRHLIALVDPFWFLVLAVDAGLAIGLYVLGAASLSLGLFAILLLFGCNYVFARAFGLFVDRLVQRKVRAALFVAILGLAIGIRQISLVVNRDPAVAEVVWECSATLRHLELRLP